MYSSFCLFSSFGGGDFALCMISEHHKVLEERSFLSMLVGSLLFRHVDLVSLYIICLFSFPRGMANNIERNKKIFWSGAGEVLKNHLVRWKAFSCPKKDGV